ncbi:MAG: flagellar hook-basal body complex protein FliE [Clostridiales bacterium]|jgi:flagellar hook-basal body complex protein FliE|nr:flagellar hook-basal body complex protein FliE [Clostridiales bacterium]
MINVDSLVGASSNLLQQTKLQEASESSTLNFSDMLVNALQSVSDDQVYAENMDRMLALGEIDNVHDVTIAAAQADLTLNLAVEVTNKVLTAYNEIMRLQL